MNFEGELKKIYYIFFKKFEIKTKVMITNFRITFIKKVN